MPGPFNTAQGHGHDKRIHQGNISPLLPSTRAYQMVTRLTDLKYVES